jgi:hypothetical protein
MEGGGGGGEVSSSNAGVPTLTTPTLTPTTLRNIEQMFAGKGSSTYKLQTRGVRIRMFLGLPEPHPDPLVILLQFYNFEAFKFHLLNH